MLKKVYFIPKLRSDIVSLGQLDEEGCKSQLYDGFLRVFDHRGELLAKVPRSRNRLYPLCLKKLVSLLPNLKQQLEPGVGGVTRGEATTTRNKTQATKTTREMKSGGDTAQDGVANVGPA